MAKIPVIGTIFVDIKGYPLGKYIPDGRNEGRMEQVHGGVGRNVAEDLANTGMEPVFVSLANVGGAGSDVISHLKEVGVSTDYVAQVDKGMGTWLAIFNEEGDVAGQVSVRPDLSPLVPLIKDNCEQIFKDADLVVLELDIDREAAELTLDYAAQYNKPVVCLVSVISVALSMKDLFPKMHCFLCNRQEAGMLFETDLGAMTPEEVADLTAEKVPELGLEKMIVTMGGDGAVYADREGSRGFCLAQPVKVVDTTGAGDSFTAGVAAALACGKSLADSCKVGAILASSTIGSIGSVCRKYTKEELGL